MIDRDVRHVVLWMDNCGPLNKNWTLLSTLVAIVNDSSYHVESITLKYFEAGHTFMSADSFHHQVEKEATTKGNLYDFEDYLQCVRNSGTCVLMNGGDFLQLRNEMSESRHQRLQDLCSITWSWHISREDQQTCITNQHILMKISNVLISWRQSSRSRWRMEKSFHPWQNTKEFRQSEKRESYQTFCPWCLKIARHFGSTWKPANKWLYLILVDGLLFRRYFSIGFDVSIFFSVCISKYLANTCLTFSSI